MHTVNECPIKDSVNVRSVVGKVDVAVPGALPTVNLDSLVCPKVDVLPNELCLESPHVKGLAGHTDHLMSQCHSVINKSYDLPEPRSPHGCSKSYI